MRKLLAILSLFAAAWSASAADRRVVLEELASRAAPAADDWESEKLAAEAGARLAELARLLSRGDVDKERLRELALEGARGGPLRPVAPIGIRVGSIRIERSRTPRRRSTSCRSRKRWAT